MMPEQHDFFGMEPDQRDLDSHTRLRDRVELASHRLAVSFSEEANLPIRFRRTSSSKPRRGKEDSEVELRFRAKVQAWRQLIETMLSKVDHSQAWRFVDLTPEVPPQLQDLTDCRDFCDFIDYLVLRRDKEQCGPDELGALALLSVALQREVEKRIQ
jgi:hypothetical protein